MYIDTLVSVPFGSALELTVACPSAVAVYAYHVAFVAPVKQLFTAPFPANGPSAVKLPSPIANAPAHD